MKNLLQLLVVSGALAIAAAGASSTISPAMAESNGLVRSPGAFERPAGLSVERVGAPSIPLESGPAPASLVIPSIASRGAREIFQNPDAEDRFQPDARCVWTPIVLGTEATGSLEAGDCHFGMLDGTLDPSYVDQFLVTTTERGSLSASVVGAVDINIEVRDMAFAALGAASAASGEAADIALVLPPGDYLILVRPSSFSSGVETGYTLTTAFAPESEPGSCSIETLELGIASAGTLGGAGACRVFDHLNDVLLDSYGDLWSIDVESSGVLSIELSSTDFSPMLILLDDTKTFTLASDAAGLAGDPDPLISTLSVNVSPGRYHVLAAGTFANGAGGYNLTANISPIDASRCTPRDVLIGEVIEGTLEEADCRLSLTPASMFDDSNVDLLSVFVVQPGTMRFVLEGEGITPTVRLLDSKLQPLLSGRLQNDDVVRIPFAGPMIIALHGLEGLAGSYSVELQFEIEGTTPCSIREIGTAETLAGALSPEDCTLEDYALLDDSSRVDLYVIRLSSRGRLTVDMRSSELDSYLWIVAGLFDYNVQNDDGDGTAEDSRLSVVLQPGEYVIVANSTLPEIGAYTLTTAFLPLPAPFPCPTRTIGPSETMTAAIGPGDCLASDFDPTRHSATPVNRHVLTLGERGRLDVFAVSESFFPRLAMRDPATGQSVIEDADEERFVMEASIGLVVGPGTYWLDIEEVDGVPDLEGSYTLTTTFAPSPAPACQVFELASLPVRLSGSIDQTDCMLRDRIGDYAQNRVDEYTFTLAQRGTLTIDLLSDDWEIFDPYLELHDYRYSPIAANNDAVEDFVPDSHLEVDLGPGRYRVLAMEAHLMHGAYDIEIAFDPAALTPPATSVVTPGSTEPTPIEPTPTAPPGTSGPVVSRIYLPFTESNR